MSASNHKLLFDPLVGGIDFGPVGAGSGTLGLLLTSDGVDRWAVTARHVLQPAGVAGVVDVIQPLVNPGGRRIATTATRRTAPDGSECAAVRIEANVPFADEIAALGRVGPLTLPHVGMRVIKAGADTGVTAGRVEQIVGPRIRIALPPAYPAACKLSDKGDSGAIWLDAATHGVVALHYQGNVGGAEWSDALLFAHVCTQLNLRIPLRP